MPFLVLKRKIVFSAVVYYIQIIWLFYWKMIFSFFGARFWSHWSVRDYVPFRHQIFAPNSKRLIGGIESFSR